LVLANTSTSELYALKRVSFSVHLTTSMKLPLPQDNLQVKDFYPSQLWFCFVSCSSYTMQIIWTVQNFKKHNFSHICFQQCRNEVSTIYISSIGSFDTQNEPEIMKGIMRRSIEKNFNHQFSIATCFLQMKIKHFHSLFLNYSFSTSYQEHLKD